MAHAAGSRVSRPSCGVVSRYIRIISGAIILHSRRSDGGGRGALRDTRSSSSGIGRIAGGACTRLVGALGGRVAGLAVDAGIELVHDGGAVRACVGAVRVVVALCGAGVDVAGGGHAWGVLGPVVHVTVDAGIESVGDVEVMRSG